MGKRIISTNQTVENRTGTFLNFVCCMFHVFVEILQVFSHETTGENSVENAAVVLSTYVFCFKTEPNRHFDPKCGFGEIRLYFSRIPWFQAQRSLSSQIQLQIQLQLRLASLTLTVNR